MKKVTAFLLASAALGSLAGCKFSSSTVKDGLTISVIDGVYIFPLSSAAKEGVKLSGLLTGGSIVIDPGNLTANESFEIDLAELSITSESAYPIYYGSKESNLIVNVVRGSENALAYNGTTDKGTALFSENNLEIEGGGRLNLLTTKAGHGFRGDDLVLAGSTDINISAIHDGIHHKTFTSSLYSGTTSIASRGSEAFDICDNDSTLSSYKGAINFGTSSGTFAIGKRNDVFEVDNSFAIPNGVSISASECLSAAVTNLNASAILVNVEVSFKANGNALTSMSVATKAI